MQTVYNELSFIVFRTNIFIIDFFFLFHILVCLITKTHLNRGHLGLNLWRKRISLDISSLSAARYMAFITHASSLSPDHKLFNCMAFHLWRILSRVLLLLPEVDILFMKQIPRTHIENILELYFIFIISLLHLTADSRIYHVWRIKQWIKWIPKCLNLCYC